VLTVDTMQDVCDAAVEAVSAPSPAEAVAARAANIGVPPGDEVPTSSPPDPALPDLHASLPAPAASTQRRSVSGIHWLRRNYYGRPM